MHSRMEWLDIAKGIGISLIFIGHIYNLEETSYFYDWMYAFHVPLFFFLSGVTFKTHINLKPFLTSKLHSIIKPYLIYALLGYLFYLSGYIVLTSLGQHLEQFSYGLWYPLVGILYGSLGDGNLVNSPLWFLPTLFWVSVFGFCINKYIQPMALRWLIVSVAFIAGMLLSSTMKLPWGLVPALLALLFFQSGYALKEPLNKKVSFVNSKVMLVLAGLFALSLLAPLNDFVGFGRGIINNPLLFLFFATIGIAMTVMIALIQPIRLGWMARMGQSSLAILVIHMLVIKSVKVLLTLLFPTTVYQLENDWAWGFLVLVVSAIATWMCVVFMQRYLAFTLRKV